MGRKLNTTTLIEGVVYEAGTDEAEVVGADTVSADVWDGEVDHDGRGGAPDAGFTSAEVAKLRGAYETGIAELREQHGIQLAERDEKIASLTAELDQVKAATANPGTSAPADYSALDIEALKAEIDRRNEGREDADRIGKRGSVETLAAALQADDAARTSKD